MRLLRAARTIRSLKSLRSIRFIESIDLEDDKKEPTRKKTNHTDMKRTLMMTMAVTLGMMLGGCGSKKEAVTLTILHTNDTHSQVEPKADNDRGGYARRMSYITAEREQDPELLLLDAGDFWQGTPYFNFLHGRVEVDALNRMGYDAATLGNHEFDNGVDTLAAVLREAKFPIVCANYRVEGTPLEGIVKPYIIVKRKGVKVGIIGLGVKPDALIAKENFAPVVWEHPYAVANRTAERLKKKEGCDVVVVLENLGTEVSHGDTEGICDRSLAEQSRNIDVIIGGHTHKVVEHLTVQNLDGEPVVLRQTGKSGVNMGKLTLTIE